MNKPFFNVTHSTRTVSRQADPMLPKVGQPVVSPIATSKMSSQATEWWPFLLWGPVASGLRVRVRCCRVRWHSWLWSALAFRLGMEEYLWLGFSEAFHSHEATPKWMVYSGKSWKNG